MKRPVGVVDVDEAVCHKTPFLSSRADPPARSDPLPYGPYKDE